MGIFYEHASLISKEAISRTRSRPMHPRHKYPEITFDHVMSLDTSAIDGLFWEAVQLGYVKGPVSTELFEDEDKSYTWEEMSLILRRAIAYHALASYGYQRQPYVSRSSSDMVHEIAEGDAEFRQASRGR